MRVRCQSCQALFWIQEGISAPGAPFPVKCGRCLSVFEAVAVARTPPPPPADAYERAPQAGEDAAAAVELLAAPQPAMPAGEAAAPPEAASDRSRWLRWTAVLTGAAVLAAAGVAIYGRVATLPREVSQRVAQGRERMLRDDARSLDEAARLFTDAVRIAPGAATPEAERAFALLLQAAAHRDLADRVPPPERDDEARLGARLLQQGTAAAKQAYSENPRDAAAVRALALSEALAGDATHAGEHAAQARLLSPDDPWTLYAQAAAAKAGKATDRALDALSRLGAAQPKLLRAQVDLAAMLADRGDAVAAREILRKVLEANAQHERARRILRLLPPAP
ncbi:MAG TPA: MJ0042-type zinc finger domain-containing protein [Myxococcales bacterium]|nr:MJ0042-type zinc finger domain-containing protein [Myxococcales bacterium]